MKLFRFGRRPKEAELQREHPRGFKAVVIFQSPRWSRGTASERASFLAETMSGRLSSQCEFQI
jgi:hypothetical protein